MELPDALQAEVLREQQTLFSGIRMHQVSGEFFFFFFFSLFRSRFPESFGDGGKVAVSPPRVK